MPEVITMSKQGMSRIDRTPKKPRNDVPPVPELQGKAKHGKTQANAVVSGTKSPAQKGYHTVPFSREKPVSSVYPAVDTDLARDNLENDIPAADLQDL